MCFINPVHLRFTTTRHLAIALCATADGSLRRLDRASGRREFESFFKIINLFSELMALRYIYQIFKVFDEYLFGK